MNLLNLLKVHSHCFEFFLSLLTKLLLHIFEKNSTVDAHISRRQYKRCHLNWNAKKNQYLKRFTTDSDIPIFSVCLPVSPILKKNNLKSHFFKKNNRKLWLAKAVKK